MTASLLRGRAGPACGVLTCLAWAPMALVIPRFPDLGSADEVEAFWRENQELMQPVALSVSVGFLFLLAFLAALDARLRQGDRALAALAFGAALMFMTALNVAIGLDVAGGLLLGSGTALTYGLHVAGFLLAAPAAFAGAAFFVACAVASFRTAVFPRWTAWLACLGAVANVGAVGGLLTLSGPFNSGNGMVGGIAGPLWLAWIGSVSVWWLRHGAAAPIATNIETVGRPG